MIDWNEKLDALRAIIAAECEARLASDHQCGQEEVAEWLVRRHRPAVIAALADLVGQVIEQLNDDARVERVLRFRPELREREPAMRLISKTLGVGCWHLLEQDDQTTAGCVLASEFIHSLREEEIEATLEAMKRLEEFIRPVTDGHPHMTVAEAFQEIERQTDETIGGLEPPEAGRGG